MLTVPVSHAHDMGLTLTAWPDRTSPAVGQVVSLTRAASAIGCDRSTLLSAIRTGRLRVLTRQDGVHRVPLCRLADYWLTYRHRLGGRRGKRWADGELAGGGDGRSEMARRIAASRARNRAGAVYVDGYKVTVHALDQYCARIKGGDRAVAAAELVRRIASDGAVSERGRTHTIRVKGRNGFRAIVWPGEVPSIATVVYGGTSGRGARNRARRAKMVRKVAA